MAIERTWIGKDPMRRSAQTESSPLRTVRNTASPTSADSRSSAGEAAAAIGNREAAPSPSQTSSDPIV